jgi:hypothetical protein
MKPVSVMSLAILSLVILAFIALDYFIVLTLRAILG